MGLAATMRHLREPGLNQKDRLQELMEASKTIQDKQLTVQGDIVNAVEDLKNSLSSVGGDF
jgi:hypothetical protein